MNMRTVIAKALTSTLRHHGVEMHPDDVLGLADDALGAMREPDEAMLEAGYDTLTEHGCNPLTGDALFTWQAMIDTARRRG